MTDSSRNYGSSLYSLAVDDCVSELIYDELKSICDILSENSEYINILDSAAVSSDEKYTLIDNAFSGKTHKYIVNFIKILAGKRLIHTFSDCCKIYEQNYRKDNNIEIVSITTAIPLTDDEKERLLGTLSAKYKKTLIPTFTTNPEIIGGIIINFENSHVDASIKTQLNEIKRVIS